LGSGYRIRDKNDCGRFDCYGFLDFLHNIIGPIPLVLATERRGFDLLALVRPRTPGPPLPTIDPLVVTPPFFNAQGIGTPVPHSIL
jgi:hypothetical protein